jgi:signal transduction histidine kinase
MKFPLAPLVVEVGEGLGLPRPERIDWSLDIEPDIHIDADRDQLFRVLSNLTRNALQALESQGEDGGEIVIAARREGSVTVIEVSDTGPGVAERAKSHLFEAFQSVARKGGTGLGLAIAAELINAHGGQIALIDNDGGATFQIAIPDVVVELKRARRRSA